MSGFKVNFSVNNQLATPSIHAAALANRPAAGQVGRVFIDSDNPSTGIYRDTGTAWVVIGMPSSPEADTLQTVTDRGNTTTNSVSIGTASAPSAQLDVHGSGVIAILQGTGTNDSFLQFNKSGNGKFKVGNVHNAGNDYFTVYNLQENSDAILVNISTNNVAIGGGTVTPTYKLDITGSLRNTGNAYFATAGGNRVGIGTTTPATTLDVNGAISGTYVNLVSSGTTVNEFRSNGLLGIDLTSSLTDDFHLRLLATNINTQSITAYGSNQIYSNGSTSVGAGNVLIFQTNGTANERARIFQTTGNLTIGYGVNPTDTGQRLQVNGTSSLSGDVTITTTTNARTLTISKGSTTNSINFQSSTGEFTFQNQSAFTINAGNGTFTHASSRLTFSGFQNSSYIEFKESSSNTQIFYIKNGDTQQWNWAKNLKIDGGTSASQCATSSLLELSSTTLGFLPPRMTTAQKSAIANTAGLIVFDTTLAKLCVNSGAGWETITSV